MVQTDNNSKNIPQYYDTLPVGLTFSLVVRFRRFVVAVF